MSFLGQGWAFPPGFGTDRDITNMTSDEEDIKQSLIIILSTRLGERIIKPQFGVGIYDLIFHNMNLTERTQLKAAIEKAVLYFEPRITLKNVILDTTEEFDGVLKIELDYIIRLTSSLAR